MIFYLRSLGWFRIAFAALLLACLTINESVRSVTIHTMADAYLQVSIFVAATLAIFYFLEHIYGINTAAFLKRYEKWQVPIASFLGALPGCGGAIMVITQYVRGRISFGSVVAALCSTMGDAAFLLLAQEPQTALLVFGVGLSVGVITGYVVDFIHGSDFLRVKQLDFDLEEIYKGQNRYGNLTKGLWITLIVPGFILGLLGALRIDPNTYLTNPFITDPTTLIGFSGALLSFILWGYLPKARDDSAIQSHYYNVRHTTENAGHVSHDNDPPLDRVMHDTNFITAWVILAFMTYEISVMVFGFNLQNFFNAWAPLIPMIAVIIGFIPGCGPQIVVTTLYLQGLIPLSAQLGNAISNDGDALFPALALAPRASVIATLYSAVPAIIVAYLWYFLIGT